MPIAHQTGRVSSGDMDIFYRRPGTPGRTPLLIVHGLSYFSYDWLPVAQALGAEVHRWLAYMPLKKEAAPVE